MCPASFICYPGTAPKSTLSISIQLLSIQFRVQGVPRILLYCSWDRLQPHLSISSCELHVRKSQKQTKKNNLLLSRLHVGSQRCRQVDLVAFGQARFPVFILSSANHLLRQQTECIPQNIKVFLQKLLFFHKQWICAWGWGLLTAKLLGKELSLFMA